MSDIYHREGVLFLNLKKNASTSARQGFKGDLLYSDGVQHAAWRDYTFSAAGCFIRNPRTRLISVWKNLVMVNRDRDFYQPLGKHMGVKFNDPFPVFLDKVLNTPDKDRDHHVAMQYYQIRECKAMMGVKVPWFYGSFENIWEDWQRWRKFVKGWSPLELPKEMPHTNRGKVPIESEIMEADWERFNNAYAVDRCLWEDVVSGAITEDAF